MDAIHLCRAARAYFSPSARWDILDRLLPYFDTTRPNASLTRAVASMLPTAPAQTLFPTGQLSVLLPTQFALLAKRAQCYRTASGFVDQVSELAKTHLVHEKTAFDAYDIFEKTQMLQIFHTIWKLTGVDDGEGGAYFEDSFLIKYSSY